MDRLPKILIADKCSASVDQLKGILREISADVVACVRSGSEAIEMVETSQPELMLTAVELDGVRSGIEVAAEIKNRFNVPTVFVSHHDQPLDLSGHDLYPLYGFALKPFNAEQIKLTLRMALQQHRLENAIAEELKAPRDIADHLMELSHHAVWQVCPEDGKAYYSPLLCDLLGYQQQDVPNTWDFLRQRVHPADLDTLLYHLEERLKVHRTTSEFVCRFKTKEGHYQQFLNKAKVVERDKMQNPSRIVGTIAATHRQTSSSPIPSSRERLLSGVNLTSQILLAGKELTTAVNQALVALGRATGVDRVTIFKINENPRSGQLSFSLTHEWARDGISPQIDNPFYQGLPFQPTLKRWLREFSNGRPIAGVTKELSPAEQQILRPLAAKSLLYIPIFQEESLWGFMGFEDCSYERQWSEQEIDILIGATNCLGSTYTLRQSKEIALTASRASPAFLPA